MKAAVLFSGGKDSCYAAYLAKKAGAEISCLISIFSKNKASYMFHTPSINQVKKQAEVMNIPLLTTETKGIKEQELEDLEEMIKLAKEKYNINGKETKVIMHRKGATRAFPPGHPEIPERYREVGQPVLIPGSMGTASYILVGQKEGERAFYSTCHGAGRTMSRHEAIRSISGQEVINNLQSKGITVKCWSLKGISEEAPMAYKNIDDVIEVVHRAGLSDRKSTRLNSSHTT
jgi:tRNA-splicing ligase RtcB